MLFSLGKLVAFSGLIIQVAAVHNTTESDTQYILSNDQLYVTVDKRKWPNEQGSL
jgi:hypothetical protein